MVQPYRANIKTKISDHTTMFSDTLLDIFRGGCKHKIVIRDMRLVLPDDTLKPSRIPSLDVPIVEGLA
jgi:hypothetical protein